MEPAAWVAAGETAGAAVVVAVADVAAAVDDDDTDDVGAVVAAVTSSYAAGASFDVVEADSRAHSLQETNPTEQQQ